MHCVSFLPTTLAPGAPRTAQAQPRKAMATALAVAAGAATALGDGVRVHFNYFATFQLSHVLCVVALCFYHSITCLAKVVYPEIDAFPTVLLL